MAFVYMLTNDKGNVLYTGATGNLKDRLYLHRGGYVAGFTKKYNVHKLVYYEEFADISRARERERQLKGKTRAKKDALIRLVNPTFSDLLSEIS